jgi:hypothetical protein
VNRRRSWLVVERLPGYSAAAIDPATRGVGLLLQEGGVPVRLRSCWLDDLFELATWEELLALLEENGPDELLRQVRAAEATDPEDRQWPRTKRSDDATAVYLVVSDAEPGTDCEQSSLWEPRSPTAPRVEGSGRTVLACPTTSRKRQSQPSRHPSRARSAA